MSNNKVIKAGIGYTVGNYLLKGLSFFTIPIFSRLLTTEDYGIVNTFGAYESFLFVIVGLAIHTSLKNARYKYQYIDEGAEKGKDYRTYVSNAYLLICMNGILLLLIAMVFGSVIGEVLKLDHLLVILLVVYSTANAIVVAYNSDASLNYEYKKFLKISYFNAVGNIICSLVLILTVFKSEKYEGRIIGIVIPIALASAYVLIKQFAANKPCNFRPMMKWGVRYSLPIVPHGISQIVLSSFDRIMITRMVSSAATGVYSFAYNIFMIVQVTASSIDSVWTPWFYERRQKEDYSTIKKVSSVYVLFLLAFSTAVMLLSPELVSILGGTKYKESIPCVIPIVCGGFFTFLYNIPATVEYYHEKTGYIAIATACAAVVNIVTNYFFIQSYGYIAAAYTTLGTYILYFFFHYYMARKIEGKALFSSKVILSSALAILIMAALMLLIVNYLWIRIILCVLCVAGFLFYADKKMGVIQKAKKFVQQRKGKR